MSGREVRDVVVVGAGIVGLTVAYRLRRAGLDVLLIEARERPGGVIRSIEVEGFLVEEGPNSYLPAPAIDALVAELGLTSEVVTAPVGAPRYIYRRGRLCPLPTGLGAFLKTPLLSPLGKLRLALEPLIPRRELADETVASFFSRRLGPEAYASFADPFVSGIYAGRGTRLSAHAAFPELVRFEREGGSLFAGLRAAMAERRRQAGPARRAEPTSFRGGLNRLPERLAAELGDALRLETPLEAVEKTGADRRPWRLNGHLEAKALVLTAPAPETARLLAGWAGRLSTTLAAMSYAPVAVLALDYPLDAFPAPPRGFGFLVPRHEGPRLLGCLYSSALFPGRAPEGRFLATAFLGGDGDPLALDLDDDALVAEAHGIIKTALEVDAAPRLAHLTRHRRAIPQATMGHLARLQTITRALDELPGLFLGGNYLHNVSLAGCVEAAGELSERVRTFLDAPAPSLQSGVGAPSGAPLDRA